VTKKRMSDTLSGIHNIHPGDAAGPTQQLVKNRKPASGSSGGRAWILIYNRERSNHNGREGKRGGEKKVRKNRTAKTRFCLGAETVLVGERIYKVYTKERERVQKKINKDSLEDEKRKKTRLNATLEIEGQFAVRFHGMPSNKNKKVTSLPSKTTSL